MPTDSVIERIAQHIQVSLSKMLGYTVERRSRSGNVASVGQKLIVIDQYTELPIDDGGQSADQSGWTHAFGLQIYVDGGQDLNQSVDAAINNTVADAEFALNGTADARTRGGLAIDTVISDVSRFDEGPLFGANVNFIVRYYTAYNDPRTPAYGG